MREHGTLQQSTGSMGDTTECVFKVQRRAFSCGMHTAQFLRAVPSLQDFALRSNSNSHKPTDVCIIHRHE